MDMINALRNENKCLLKENSSLNIATTEGKRRHAEIMELIRKNSAEIQMLSGSSGDAGSLAHKIR